MTYRLTFRHAVAGDLEKAVRWYEKQQVGLGDAFMDCFRVAAKELLLQPLAFGFVHRDIRRMPIKRFPYGIFYGIANDEIAVVAVLHGRQSMRRLRNRD